MIEIVHVRWWKVLLVRFMKFACNSCDRRQTTEWWHGKDGPWHGPAWQVSGRGVMGSDRWENISCCQTTWSVKMVLRRVELNSQRLCETHALWYFVGSASISSSQLWQFWKLHFFIIWYIVVIHLNISIAKHIQLVNKTSSFKIWLS